MKMMQYDNKEWPIRDEGTQVHFIDWLTEAWQAEGVVAISLGVGFTDGEKGEVHVPIRFRTTIKNAKHIRDTLTRLVAEAEQPA